MNRSGLARYGWMIALLAVGALWLRIEGAAFNSRAAAAPNGKADQRPTPPPAVIAVMNFDEIWDNYKTYIDQVAACKKEWNDFEAEVKLETKAIYDVTEQYKLQPDGSEAKLQLQFKYNQMSLALESRMKLKSAEFERRMTEIWHDRYQEIENAAKLVARQRKFDIVFLSHSHEMRRDNQKSVLSVINRNVVFCRDEFDITEDVLALLNSK